MRKKELDRMIRQNMKRLAAEIEPSHPVIPAFELDPLPDAFSLDWERQQIRKLKDFCLNSEVNRQLELWTDVIHYRERAFVQDQRDYPFVRARLLRHLDWDHDLTSLYSQKDMAAVWRDCEIRHRAYKLFPDGNFDDKWKEIVRELDEALTWRQKLIAKRLYKVFPEQNRLYEEACRQLNDITHQLRQDIEKRLKKEYSAAQDAYQAHLDSLPPDQLFAVGYEIAKEGCSRGSSGFHHGSALYLPFGFCGWADYEYTERIKPFKNNQGQLVEAEWGEYVHQTQGVAFRIVKPCFGDRNPLLYYNGERGIRDKGLFVQTVQKYSSGIGDIRIESTGGYHDSDVFFTFRLDAGAIRETVRLNGRDIRTTDAGGHYIFVLPCAGEFNCELGEIINGKRIPLHYDNFCMK